MDFYTNLFIRACKRNHVSDYIFKRIMSKRNNLDICYVKDEDIVDILLSIVTTYDLMDLHMFHYTFSEHVRSEQLWNQMYGDKEIKTSTPMEIFKKSLITAIRFAKGDKFPECVWPLRFRKKIK